MVQRVEQGCTDTNTNIQYNRYWSLPENSDTLKKYRLFDTSKYWLRHHLKVSSTLYQNKLYFR